MLPNIFYVINFTISILLSTIGIIFSCVTIFIVIRTRRYRTFNNVLICNTSVAAIFYSLITISASILGYREDWSSNAPLCSFRAYLYNVGIATVCHSKSIHAISRLFFAILYKRRYLLTWRTHRILIILTWLICLIICIPPFFFDDGYALEEESRSCVISSKKYLLALYVSMVSCIIPFNIIAMVYVSILFSVRRSARRVWAFNQNVTNVDDHMPKSKREIKLMQQMIIQTGILVSGGPIFIFLILWHATQKQPPPEWLYLLGFNSLTIVGSTVPIVQFMMSKQLRQSVTHFFKKRQRAIGIRRPIRRQQQIWNIT
jgi:hypothetical protein